MSQQSPNLLLPFLAPGQAQKHVTVNDSLRRLDALVQLSVVSASTGVEPGSPADGAVYIIPAGKTGIHWAGFSNGSLAHYRHEAWEEIAPREGWIAFVKDADYLLYYSGSAWRQFPAAGVLTVSASDRLLGRVSSGAGVVEEVTFTDQAQQLADDGSFREMCATLGTWRVLAASAVAASHTGDTLEAQLATISVPAGAMGPNGLLRILSLWSVTSSANIKTPRVRLGGVSGAEFFNPQITTSLSHQALTLISNRNTASSQVCFPSLAGSTVGSSGVAVTTASVNTANAQDIVLSGQCANSSDTITLQRYVVELFYGA